jgi:very-short-patch-repair endonuclease
VYKANAARAPSAAMSTIKTGSVPTLQTLLRATHHQVTGVRDRTATASGDSEDNRYPGALMVRGVSDVGLNRSKVANFQALMGGGSSNVMNTAPGFYSPFTTPSSFQIPTNRKEQYLWASWWEQNEPKVAAGVEFYAQYPLSGFSLECANEAIKDHYEEEVVRKLKIDQLLSQISHCYHLYGDAFAYAMIDCPKCHGENVDQQTGEECDHAGARWHRLTLLNPDQIEVSPSVAGERPAYFLFFDEFTKKVVNERKPPHIYNALSPTVKFAVQSNQPVKLADFSIHHFKRMAFDWQPYGTSLIRRLFTILAYKDKLRQAQYLVAERHILPMKIAKIGTDEHRANQEDLEAFQMDLAAAAQDPIITLVTHHAVDIDYVGATGKVLTLTNEFELIDQEMNDGLMLTKGIINGEGPSYAGNQVGVQVMAKRLERFRKDVKWWLENCIFRPYAEWNGFTQPGKFGQDELVYPKVKWDDLELRDKTNRLNQLITLHQSGVVSTKRLLAEFEIDHDEEIEWLRLEQSAGTLSSPAIVNGDIGAGYGGEIAGFQSGMPPSMGAGGMPQVAPMTPMGGPDMTQGVPPPMPVADHHEAYVKVASTVSLIYDHFAGSSNRQLERLASRKNGFVSDAQRMFLESATPVSGRAWSGPLDPDFNLVSPAPVGPHGGGRSSIAMNAFAIAERRADIAAGHEFADGSGTQADLDPRVEERLKQLLYQTADETARSAFASQRKKGPRVIKNNFTSWESALYDIVISASIPIPFYAQYAAGPGNKYQLDGAFPSIKLGLEADSRTFHATPDAIAKDKRRDAELAMQGWTILRFKEEELKQKKREVLQVIVATVNRLMSGV